MWWTKEQDVLLKQSWENGESARQIANKIGKTRNAVIGRANRMHLTTHDVAYADMSRDLLPVAPIPKRGTPQPQWRFLCTPIKAQPPMPTPVEPQLPSQLIGIMQLTDETCRWPVGTPGKEGFGFCGAQTALGSVYCSHHWHKSVVHQKRR
jgi:GcrA cell cycle regulator